MFTLDQLKEAHSKVKSGADFPRYIQDIMRLGVKRYTTYVADGHSVYEGDASFRITSPAKYAEVSILPYTNKEFFRQQLKAHQRGETDYMSFIQDCVASGVTKWTSDLQAMTCTYFDIHENVVLVEDIPVV